MQDLPIHLYDLGTAGKIPSEVMIRRPVNLVRQSGSFLCLTTKTATTLLFSANQREANISDTPDATANSRINARLPYLPAVAYTR